MKGKIMQEMIITREEGENGYNYTLEREDKNLKIECFNGYENMQMRVSLETMTDYKFSIDAKDEVYDIFHNFYTNQKKSKEIHSQTYSITYGINMKKEKTGYTLDLTKCNGVADISVPNYGWINMFHELQEITPTKKRTKTKLKR